MTPDMMSSTSELDRWLSFERLARSDLMRHLNDGYRDGCWRGEGDVESLAFMALLGFGNGCCFYLASAIGNATGFPVAAFWRADDPGLPIVHAAIVDPLTGQASDILGRRPIGVIRQELTEAVGPIRVSAQPSLDDMSPDEETILLGIAAGLPWMPATGRPVPSWSAWGQMVVAYVSSRFGWDTEEVFRAFRHMAVRC